MRLTRIKRRDMCWDGTVWPDGGGVEQLSPSESQAVKAPVGGPIGANFNELTKTSASRFRTSRTSRALL